MHKYVIDRTKLIAQGSNSKIYTCRNTIGMRAICKEISKKKTLPINVEREVECLSLLSHSSKVVQLFDVFEDSESYYLIQEWCRGGSIQDYINSHAPNTEHTVASIVRDVLRGLVHVHSEGVVHRDIKPGNILFIDDSYSEVKLADFGAAFLCTTDGLMDVGYPTGTPWYMAPETLRSTAGYLSDIWSIGIMTYQLLAGRAPFQGKTAENIWRNILTTKPSMETDDISADAIDFVKGCLAFEYIDRPSAIECLEHPWIVPR